MLHDILKMDMMWIFSALSIDFWEELDIHFTDNKYFFARLKLIKKPKNDLISSAPLILLKLAIFSFFQNNRFYSKLLLWLY